METDLYAFRGYQIPDYMREGINRYIEHGIEPGSFLTAVIQNDFVNAVAQADDNNIRNLPAYANYFYNHAPSQCWGSAEVMNEWIGLKREERND